MDTIRPGPGVEPPRFTIRYVPATLYRRDGITITSAFFEVRGRRYPVRELSELWRVLPPHEPARFHALLISMALAALVLVAPLPWAPQPPPTAAWLLVAVLTSVMLTIRLVRIRRRPQAAELWGRFRGRTVRLFATTDRTQFGQVYRALLRARERADTPR